MEQQWRALRECPIGIGNSAETRKNRSPEEGGEVVEEVKETGNGMPPVAIVDHNSKTIKNGRDLK